jgi:2-keto-4-pentenoate hydratase/2-oxohepta-3-ene-1,7-dioic acid hydratase in catechol pathway
MKYLMFSDRTDATPRLGAWVNGRVIDAAAKWPGTSPRTLLDLIVAGPDAWTRMAGVLANASGGVSPDEIRWHAPIPRPRKNIFCLGLNYSSHVAESSAARGRDAKIPQVPVFFTKAPTTVNGPFDPVPWDQAATQQVDYEVELGVVIGRDGKNISRGDALSHVFGYTIVNDVSARDLQLGHLQWFKGKSLDGFCPMGPCVVTADEFGDPQTKRISLRLNGETRQDSNTSKMIFPIDVTIEFLSRGLTLEAGDIIATGTPEGVGLGRTPPEYMKDGDMMEAEIEGIGTLRNAIAATSVVSASQSVL